MIGIKKVTVPEGGVIRITAGDTVIHDRTAEIDYRLHSSKTYYIADGLVDGSAGDVAAVASYVGELPVKEINEYAFQDETDIRVIILPSTIIRVEAGVFNGCTNLESVTFQSTPSTWTGRSTAFADCTNLTTINVPWAEGAVSGAPWGATNATINYNYSL